MQGVARACIPEEANMKDWKLRNMRKAKLSAFISVLMKLKLCTWLQGVTVWCRLGDGDDG